MQLIVFFGGGICGDGVEVFCFFFVGGILENGIYVWCGFMDVLVFV